MPVSVVLLERSGDLKGEVVDFALRRFATAFDRVLEQALNRVELDSEADSINLIDAFVLQHRLSDGRTPLERFVAEHPDLPEDERELLLGWRDVVKGVFEVKQHDGEALDAVNLVDELVYRVRSVVPGGEVTERMRAFLHDRTQEERDEQGQTTAERARQRHGHPPAEVELEFPEEVCEAGTVAMVYDEVEGLNLYANFGLVQEAFTDPALAARGRHRQVVRDWLDDPSVSPLPFRRLVEPDPAKASQVFARVLRRRGFLWERDGEALLRRRKASFFQQPVLPGITVLPDHLARHLVNAGQARKPRSQG